MIALIILIRSHNLSDRLERVLAALNTPERALDWHAEAGPGKSHVLEHAIVPAQSPLPQTGSPGAGTPMYSLDAVHLAHPRR